MHLFTLKYQGYQQKGDMNNLNISKCYSAHRAIKHNVLLSTKRKDAGTFNSTHTLRETQKWEGSIITSLPLFQPRMISFERYQQTQIHLE